MDGARTGGSETVVSVTYRVGGGFGSRLGTGATGQRLWLGQRLLRLAQLAETAGRRLVCVRRPPGLGEQGALYPATRRKRI